MQSWIWISKYILQTHEKMYRPGASKIWLVRLHVYLYSWHGNMYRWIKKSIVTGVTGVASHDAWRQLTVKINGYFILAHVWLQEFHDIYIYTYIYFFFLIYFIMTSISYTSHETSTCKYCLAGKTSQHWGNYNYVNFYIECKL